MTNIVTVYWGLSPQDPNAQVLAGDLLIGLGCASAWLGLIRYMETSTNYSILGKTLFLSMPNTIKTMISTLPVLMGFTFLGVALFWRSNRFDSASGCLATLYALMFGDMVYDTFYDVMGISWVWG